MNALFGVCVCVLLTLVASQRPTEPPVVRNIPQNVNVEPYRPIVAARPVVEDEMSIILAECMRRISINASIAHKVQVPSDCSVFASCEFPESGVKPVMTLCPAGLLFNDDMDVMACVRPVNANCRQGNPCAGKPDGYNQDGVRSQETQGAYYLCRNDQTISGGWCDLGEQYLNFERSCLSIPDLARPIPPVRDPVPCHLQRVEGDASSFLLGDTVMQCAGNTIFNPISCVCEYGVSITDL